MVPTRWSVMQTAETLHFALVIILIVMIVIHAGAAVKHHFLDRDDVLAAMTPFLEPLPKPRPEEPRRTPPAPASPRSAPPRLPRAPPFASGQPSWKWHEVIISRLRRMRATSSLSDSSAGMQIVDG